MSTAQEFLERLKIHYRNEPIIEGGVNSEKFSELNKAELDSFDEETKEKLTLYRVEDDHIVKELVNEVFPILTPDEYERAKNIAFGKLYNMQMNAFCAKSQDGLDNYCIVLNHGLLMLLHKFGKLLAAKNNPEGVSFCNREEDLSKITSNQYYDWALELIANYKHHKAPVGAMVKLKPEMNYQHALVLHFQELFVLCHELGHFFNNDLTDKRNLTYLIEGEAEVIAENKHYQMEYNADLYAFDLVSRVARQKYKLEKKDLLNFIIMLFDTMAMINPEKGPRHPAAISRIMNVISENWGKKVAKQYLKTYDSGANFKDFYDKLN